MYQIRKTQKEYCCDPWNGKYEKRIEVLKLAKKQHRNTVAFLYPGFDSSTFRYRGYNVSETLDYSMYWSGAYFELADLANLTEDVSVIDVMVIIRCEWDDELEQFITLIKSRGIKLCYDVDDLIYNPKYMKEVINAIGLKKEDYSYWFGLTTRHSVIAEKCDAYITTNEYLAKYLRDDYQKDCYVIKNYLNWTQEKVSEYYFQQKMEMDSEKPFTIGYFSGSPTHVKDLMVALPEIEELFEKYEDVKLQIVGYMNLPNEYGKWIKKGRIEYIPFQTFVGLQYEQAKVDVNIVPLVNNVFSNCKSELKYFESAIVGTITCATPSFTYSSAISSGDNGYICEKGEWFSTLEKIYKEGVTNEKKQHIRDVALKEYSNYHQLGHVECVFDSILNGR